MTLKVQQSGDVWQVVDTADGTVVEDNLESKEAAESAKTDLEKQIAESEIDPDKGKIYDDVELTLSPLQKLKVVTTSLKEESDDVSLQDFLDANNIYRFESDTRNLEKVTEALGYLDLREFLGDNSGAQQAIIEWIAEWVERSPEWKASLKKEMPDSQEE